EATPVMARGVVIGLGHGAVAQVWSREVVAAAHELVLGQQPALEIPVSGIAVADALRGFGDHAAHPGIASCIERQTTLPVGNVDLLYCHTDSSLVLELRVAVPARGR